MSENIANEIRRRMQLLNLKPATLSRDAGLGPTAVRDILEGRIASPTEKTLRALAKQLGCSIGDLTGEKRVKPSALPGNPEHVPILPAVAEIDVRGGLGSGGEALVEAFTTHDGYSISADVVRSYWGIPDSYLLGELSTTRQQVRIIEVRGDSMSPVLESGDRIMVDLTDVNPSMGGPFALWDGYGVVVKRLERVPKSDPPAIRLISENDSHKPYELTLDEARIIGRVIWFARKL